MNEIEILPALEFKILTKEDAYLKAIEFNSEDLKMGAIARVEKYKNLTYDDSQVKSAKEDRADLRRVIDSIENARKWVKKKVNQPYMIFEAELKEVTAIIEKPMLEIDKQVKEFEQKKKDKKMVDLTEYYESNHADLLKIVPFKRIFVEQWQNSSYGISKAFSEITAKANEITNFLDSFKALNLPENEEIHLKDFYLRNFDAAATLSEKVRMDESKKKIKEFEAKKEVEKPIETAIIVDEIAPKEEIYEATFKVVGTTSELKALGKYLKENNLKYTNI